MNINYGDTEYTVARYQSLDDIDFETVDKAQIAAYRWEDNGIEYEAYGRLVYVENYGFVCKMACREENPWANYKNDGEDVYLDSALEFFGRFTEKGYVNCENNALGVRLQQFGTCRFDRESVWAKLPEGFDVTADREGEMWTVTVYLPLEKLRIFYGDIDNSTFKKGYTFTGNFYKTGLCPKTGESHYGMWHEIKSEKADFHLPDLFGTFVMG